MFRKKERFDRVLEGMLDQLPDILYRGDMHSFNQWLGIFKVGAMFNHGMEEEQREEVTVGFRNALRYEECEVIEEDERKAKR